MGVLRRVPITRVGNAHTLAHCPEKRQSVVTQTREITKKRASMSHTHTTRQTKIQLVAVGTLPALLRDMTNAEYAAQVNKFRRASQQAQVAEIKAILRKDFEAAQKYHRVAETFAKLAGPYISRDEW